MIELEKIINIEKMIDVNSLKCDEESLNTIKKFIDDYKTKSKRLEKILKISDKQQMEIFKLNESLNSYKTELEKMFEKEKQKNKVQEELLVEQSKYAAMGQMIDSIAHQWSQPLSVIQLLVDSLKYDYMAEAIDEEFINNYQKDVSRQLSHLTSTLKEFRDFYRPDKEQVNFDVYILIQKVLLLQKDEFLKNQIEFKINHTDNFYITGIENEFKHLFINLFNNSKDAYIENNLKIKKTINIKIYHDEKNKIIEVLDNAGGIPENIIDNIFKLNFTTKANLNGTGVGLHLCQEIVSKHNGVISVANEDNGAKFTIKFPK